MIKKLANELVLPEVREDVTKLASVVPTQAIFDKQFRAFTNDVFADWSSELWNNVFVVGGSVLACLLLIQPGHEQLKTKAVNSYHEFNFRGSSTTSSAQEPSKDPQHRRHVHARQPLPEGRR